MLNPSIKVVDENPSTYWLILPLKINPETKAHLLQAEPELVFGSYDVEGMQSVAFSWHLSDCFNYT